MKAVAVAQRVGCLAIRKTALIIVVKSNKLKNRLQRAPEVPKKAFWGFLLPQTIDLRKAKAVGWGYG